MRGPSHGGHGDDHSHSLRWKPLLHLQNVPVSIDNFHLVLVQDVHAVVFDNVPLCCRVVEEGLSYRFHASWPFVLQVLGCFYRAAGKKAHPVMLKVQ